MRVFADDGGLSSVSGPLMISLTLVLLVLLVAAADRDADRVAGVPARPPLAGMAPGRGRHPAADADARAGT